MNKEQQIEYYNLMSYASKSASIITLLGLIFGLLLSSANKYFSSLIINNSINITFGIILFCSVFLLARNQICSFYTKTQYFHFFITSFIFGQLIYWCLQPAIVEGNYGIFSFKLFILNSIIYHCGEFFFVCLNHPDTLKWRSRHIQKFIKSILKI